MIHGWTSMGSRARSSKPNTALALALEARGAAL